MIILQADHIRILSSFRSLIFLESKIERDGICFDILSDSVPLPLATGRVFDFFNLIQLSNTKFSFDFRLRGGFKVDVLLCLYRRVGVYARPQCPTQSSCSAVWTEVQPYKQFIKQPLRYLAASLRFPLLVGTVAVVNRLPRVSGFSPEFRFSFSPSS